MRTPISPNITFAACRAPQCTDMVAITGNVMRYEITVMPLVHIAAVGGVTPDDFGQVASGPRESHACAARNGRLPGRAIAFFFP
jgi:hypothetical protein